MHGNKKAILIEKKRGVTTNNFEKGPSFLNFNTATWNLLFLVKEIEDLRDRECYCQRNCSNQQLLLTLNNKWAFNY